MNFLSKLERKLGRLAIPNLSRYLLILYVVGAIISIIPNTNLYIDFLALNPYLILHGQIWRLFTFMIAPPSANLIFLILVLLCYYNLCQELEYYWGDFKFNLYILVGVLGTIIASFILYFVTGR